MYGKKKFSATLGVATVLALLASLLSFALLSAPAQAASIVTTSTDAGTTNEPPSCEGKDTTKGTGECADVVESESHSMSSASSKVVAVNGVKLNSKTTVLARVKAKGTPKAQQTNCWRLKKATRAWTTYGKYLGSGSHLKSYPAGYRLCKVDGKTRDPICHNIVFLKRPVSRPPKNAVFGKVKFVVRLKFETAAVAKADEKVTSRAKAWCTTTHAYGYGEGRGFASAYAVGRARLSGYVLTTVLARVRAAAQDDLEAQLEGKTVTQVKGEVRASAFVKATSEAHAKAVCSETEQPTPTPTPTPVPENQKPTGEIVQFPAHLYPGGEYRAKVVGSDPEDGGNATLNYTVSGGASKIVDANHPEICDVEGTQKVCTFWIKAGSTAGTNATLTLTVKDSRGATSPTYTKTWPIVADEF